MLTTGRMVMADWTAAEATNTGSWLEAGPTRRLCTVAAHHAALGPFSGRTWRVSIEISGHFAGFETRPKVHLTGQGSGPSSKLAVICCRMQARPGEPNWDRLMGASLECEISRLPLCGRGAGRAGHSMVCVCACWRQDNACVRAHLHSHVQ